MNLIVLQWVLFLIHFVTVAKSARILAIFSDPSPSHYIYASALLKELAARGHEVTSVNVFPQKTPIQNFNDIFIEKNTHLFEEFVKEAQDGSAGDSLSAIMNHILKSGERMCINIFENPEFQELLQNPEGKFDLLIAEVAVQDSLYGLGEHFKVPMIGMSIFGTFMGIDDIVGNTSPNSIIPYTVSFFPTKMNFWTRVQNFWLNLRTYFLIYYKNYYIQKDLYHKYFPNATVDFNTVRKNFSLLILNQHHSLSYPRPYVPNVVEAGGLHIKKNPESLPSDLQKWLDDAPYGAVYFSMGSNINSKDLPPHVRDIFLNVFRKLKQKVLWKFEDPHLPNKPDNVLINPWLPQPSVLNHPNIKVFMTHGGLLSTTEAIFYGIPILGIPMFGDQPRNIKMAVNRGTALSVNLVELKEEELAETLNELLYNPKYMQKMKTISAHFHDQPLTPMETAVYWIEYVLKHGGEHLRNAGADLNIFQYYSVDVVVFYLTVLMFILAVSIFIIKTIIKALHTQKNLKKKKI